MSPDIYNFFGTDETGVIRKGKVGSEGVLRFVVERFDKGWVTLDVMDNANVRVAGIDERFRSSSSVPFSRTWFTLEEEKCNRCNNGRVDFGEGPRACLYCLGTQRVTKGSKTNVAFGSREEGTGTRGE